MQPQDDRQRQYLGATSTPQRTPDPVADNRQARQQQAAADLIRHQLDNIYSGGSSEDTPQTTPLVQPQAVANTDQQLASTEDTKDNEEPSSDHQLGHGFRTAPTEESDSPAVPAEGQTTQTRDQNTSPYQRTMSESGVNTQPTENQWQQYHEAWQKYYQLYYERHYLNQLSTQKPIVSQTDPEKTQALNDGTISKNEAMSELRQTIRNKVSASTEKVKKSRHFVPALAGLSVLLLVAFLQWNQVLFGAIAAYASPGSIEPQNIIPSPITDVNVGPEPKMIIPKINIDAPVIYDMPLNPSYAQQMKAMESGVAHFPISGASAVPGQIGNAVFSAHSSNDVFAPGDYKQVFAPNEKLTKGDLIYMNYESKRYVYSVTRTEVVLPSEVSKIQIETDKPMLTLISCVPVGTAQKRLLVFAEQVSPDPAKAKEASADNNSKDTTNKIIPGQSSPTLIERLFGAN